MKSFITFCVDTLEKNLTIQKRAMDGPNNNRRDSVSLRALVTEDTLSLDMVRVTQATTSVNTSITWKKGNSAENRFPH